MNPNDLNAVLGEKLVSTDSFKMVDGAAGSVERLELKFANDHVVVIESRDPSEYQSWLDIEVRTLP